MAKKQKKLGTIKHDKQSRPNIPTAEMESLVKKDELTPTKRNYERKNNPTENPELYVRNPDLDPQLVWAGKEQDDTEPLSVEAVPIYIQEKIHPQVIIENLRRQTQQKREERSEATPKFFDDFNGLVDEDARVEFYQHRSKWSNRMILGDSLLVMASLEYKEDYKGKVQCIYMDPPYGISFRSNWQPSTKSTNVGKEETREPEMIQAFRDTWKKGINSYLPYLRDRFSVARELLTESGSIFVQISDQNLHYVREVMDEVFGVDNFVSLITYRTSGGLGSKTISKSGSYLVWYAKNKESMKYRQLFIEKAFGQGTMYTRIKKKNGEDRPMNKRELQGFIDSGDIPYRLDNLLAAGATTSCIYDFEFEDQIFTPKANRSWKTNLKGMNNLRDQGRIAAPGETLQFIAHWNDFPVSSLTNFWTDTVGELSKSYVVQTAKKVIQRCILMTTDPGDLVLDPTCGSGTTAFVAEQWGRRWITCDTSRVALALARARLMGARYDYYLMKDSEEGAKKEMKITAQPSAKKIFTNDIQQGFVYETVPHISLGSLAQDEESKTETLYDRPYTDNSIVRVTGPFTLESLSPHRILPTDAEDEAINAMQSKDVLEDEGYWPQRRSVKARPKSETSNESTFMDIVFENLQSAGVQNTKRNERLEFTELNPSINGRHIQFAGRFEQNGKEKKVAVCVGPEYGTVTRSLLVKAAREAADMFDMLVVLGFAFEAHADEQMINIGDMPVWRARMNNDLHMSNRLQSSRNGNLFVVFGEPDVDCRPSTTDSEMWEVEIKGVDIFDPKTGDVKSGGIEDIACWMIDTNYDEESFFVRQAYFSGSGKDPYKQLKSALKAEIDKDAWERLYTSISLPFPKPSTGRIAVKAINHYGDEVIKIFEIEA